MYEVPVGAYACTEGTTSIWFRDSADSGIYLYGPEVLSRGTRFLCERSFWRINQINPHWTWTILVPETLSKIGLPDDLEFDTWVKLQRLKAGV